MVSRVITFCQLAKSFYASLELSVFLSVVSLWSNVKGRRQGLVFEVQQVKTNFKIGAVCVQKQRDAPGLSNELSKKCSWSVPMTINW